MEPQKWRETSTSQGPDMTGSAFPRRKSTESGDVRGIDWIILQSIEVVH